MDCNWVSAKAMGSNPVEVPNFFLFHLNLSYSCNLHVKKKPKFTCDLHFIVWFLNGQTVTTTSQGFLAKSPGANGLGLETNKCTLTCSYHCWISQLMWLTWSIQDARYSNYCKCFVHLVSEESENKCCYNVVLIQSQIYLQNESNKEAIITTFFVPILQSLLQLHCWIL